MKMNGIPVEFLGQEFLTVAEAAGYLNVSKMTVYRLCKSGEMETVRVGRAFRIYLRPFFRKYGYVEKATVVSIPTGDELN